MSPFVFALLLQVSCPVNVQDACEQFYTRTIPPFSEHQMETAPLTIRPVLTQEQIDILTKPQEVLSIAGGCKERQEQDLRAEDELQHRIITVAIPPPKRPDEVASGSIEITKTGRVRDMRFSSSSKGYASVVRKAAKHWSFSPADQNWPLIHFSIWEGHVQISIPIFTCE